jgi:hypothetical protein
MCFFCVMSIQKSTWVFEVDPDNRSGALEWLIVGVLFLVTIALFTLATLRLAPGSAGKLRVVPCYETGLAERSKEFPMKGEPRWQTRAQA